MSRSLHGDLTTSVTNMDAAMSAADDHAGVIFRYAVWSATGQWREADGDAGNASARLLAVADGTGGDDTGGAVASSALTASATVPTNSAMASRSASRAANSAS